MGTIEWNVNMVALQLGSFGIRWYSLLFLASFFAGYQYMKHRLAEKGFGLEVLDSLLMHSMISTILGARLGHCLFYEPNVYLNDPIRILKVWEGGLASHGALIGILIGLYLFTRKFKINYLWLLDRYVIPVALAGCFIRLGNLMNSEIIGKPTGSDWGFVFKQVDDIPRHPTQIYESMSYLISFLLLHTLFKTTSLKEKPGFFSGLFFVLIFSFRFGIEFLKEHQVAFESSLPLDMGQLLSIPVVLIGVFLMVFKGFNSPKLSY